MSLWLLPPIWRYAMQHRLISQSDFFACKYDGPALGVLVAIAGVIALVAYLVLQLKGLGIIMSVASYGAIPPTAAVWIGAAVVTHYVSTSGIHGSAWTSVLKDVMILVVVVLLGVYLPLHFHGGYGPMFRRSTRRSRASWPSRPGARAWCGSGPPSCSPRWASTCGRTHSARSTRPGTPGCSSRTPSSCRCISSCCCSRSWWVLQDLNIGIVALAANLVAIAVVSAVTGRARPRTALA